MPHIQVGKGTLEQIENPDYSKWTLEELLGVRTDKRGKRRGRPPKVVPMARIHEITRRLQTEEFVKVAQATSEIIDYLLAVATGEIESDKERTDVCRWFYERIFGTAPVKLELSATAPSVYEKAGVMRAVILRDPPPPAIDVKSREDDPWA